jgi:hypothetical protein
MEEISYRFVIFCQIEPRLVARFFTDHANPEYSYHLITYQNDGICKGSRLNGSNDALKKELVSSN